MGTFFRLTKCAAGEERESELQDEGVFSPAHDLVCQQHSAHLGVFVLAFINNRLEKRRCKEREEDSK